MTEHITVRRELLRQVLETTERSKETAMHQTLIARTPESGLFGGIAQDLDWAATELRAALEQPAVEPVAEVVYLERGGNAGIATRIVEIDDPRRERLQAGTKLFTAPSPQQPALEPVAWIRPSGRAMLDAGGYCTVYAFDDGMSNHSVPLYTAPQPPADVPLLTDDERQEIINANGGYGGTNLVGVSRAIEQAVRQKAGLK